jgi:hypothetical protein
MTKSFFTKTLKPTYVMFFAGVTEQADMISHWSLILPSNTQNADGVALLFKQDEESNQPYTTRFPVALHVHSFEILLPEAMLIWQYLSFSVSEWLTDLLV